MQKVDLIVDGATKAVNQRSDSVAFQRRVTAAYQHAGRVEVVQHQTPAPTPSPLPHPSIWSGRGVFTTTDITRSHGLNVAWTAIQKDPEGDQSAANVPGTLVWWQARPTKECAIQANLHGVPLIWQAENLDELRVCLDTFDACPLTVPHAIVGKVEQSWGLGHEAVARGFDLILEWYWNNQPTYIAPNADNYPLFRNVCFGTFGSDNPANPGRRVSVAEYRKVWGGPFSAWDAEGMDTADRAAFNLL